MKLSTLTAANFLVCSLFFYFFESLLPEKFNRAKIFINLFFTANKNSTVHKKG
jgi:hypothetical protein